ncbi:hypothetical protein AALO_G00083610 [Alosa alosa]|uniref:E3 ubiquitin-protein ligase RNF25 n=1 Tax=Alosa alosa TaxID=278164 RepID=A0AAV6GXW5_9TELE|nr:hypothetical protein AALO_G00083610 [Alosa alosa]
MAAENDVHSEIEVLQSIYLDELKVTQRKKGGWEVSLVLYPSTAEDVLSQFVRLTLTLTLAPQYPYIPPVISIHNPRGLSDDKLLSVQRCLQMEAESCPGAPVLYQVIEKAKEILTESNIPHGNCVICLYGFKDGEAFTKTSCYHYFHSHCLGRYVSHSEMELREREREIEEDKSRGRMDGEELAVVCPVCREPLACDVDALLSSPAPVSPETAGAVVGADFRQKWVELKRIWERQRQRGGIIDPEVESNRFLIHINEGPSETCDPTSGTSDLPPTPLETPAPISQPSIPQPSIPQYPGHGSRRCHYGRRGRGHNKGGRRGRGGQVHAGIPEAMPDFTKLSLASEKHNHVRGDTMVLNGTYVDTVTQYYNPRSPLQRTSRPTGRRRRQKGHAGAATGSMAGGNAHITRGNRSASGRTGTSEKENRETLREARTITGATGAEAGAVAATRATVVVVVVLVVVGLTAVPHVTRTKRRMETGPETTVL